MINSDVIFLMVGVSWFSRQHCEKAAAMAENALLPLVLL
jgi:hypothetical protein